MGCCRYNRACYEDKDLSIYRFAETIYVALPLVQQELVGLKLIFERRMPRPQFSFEETVTKIRGTVKGQEAAMYGPLRDLFVNVLNYSPSDVDIDVRGDDGRPDLTVRASSGLVTAGGAHLKISWIVVEAKDERGCFKAPDSREDIFAEKAKYIGTNTGWFVMVDPTVFVARQVGGRQAWDDIVIPLTESLTQASFLAQLASLKSEVAGVSALLRRFREGDLTLIGVEKLGRPSEDAVRSEIARYKVAKKRFFSNLRESTQHLQDSCLHSLKALLPQIEEIQQARTSFEKLYGYGEAADFDSNTLTLTGRPQGPTESRQHNRDSRELRRRFSKDPVVTRLALAGLPDFQARTGVSQDKLYTLFAIETGNLILTRILLLRFFEDHGFFGDKRYVCNGGVSAFQAMREYFQTSYTQLLEQAYKRASRLYAAAFDETELDWVFGSGDPELSRAIEWALFEFSRYDFLTIKGDILTGIYDRFMDRDKRKEMGEFYTPPSIARYIVKRVGISPGDRVFDPACGSGTFLLETFRETVGIDIERGVAEFSDAREALMNIAGNDLNTFSSVLAQIQLLWQILAFKDDIQKDGFPVLHVTSRVNSLVVPDMYQSVGEFGALDVPEYAAVVGNPPYVRKERSAQALDVNTSRWFAADQGGCAGISVAGQNAYGLFIYRALTSWCRPFIEGTQDAGKLGFVVPVSLFDSNESKDLRSLFEIGARWTIKEILDLEIIYRQVFDADTLPAIIICENRPATSEDTVSIRIASRECVHPGEDGALPAFDFEALHEERIPYADLFAPDGRIFTRMTNPRLRIIRSLWKNPSLEAIAKRYWVRREKNVIAEWKTTDNNLMHHGWEEKRMLTRGIVFRGQKEVSTDGVGLAVYKGENIIAGELQGSPSIDRCNVSLASDPSLWRYSDILPNYAFAIAQVAHAPNAVRFNPSKIAFTDTATIFIPAERARHVPFDLLFLSNVYVFFAALAARMGVLRQCRSHMYPTNMALLPWNDALIEQASALEAMRSRIVDACTNAERANLALLKALGGLQMRSLKELLKIDRASTIVWGPSFQQKDYSVNVLSPRVEDIETWHRVYISDGLFDWVELSDTASANGLFQALKVSLGEEISKSDILNLKVPHANSEIRIWNETLSKFQPESLDAEKKDAIRALDTLVGAALGLTMEDLELIWNECSSDPFLKRIVPRYPGTTTRKQGFRTGLGASERYQ